jgi:succinoglycan biosynthesis transport protein ExoP
MNAVGPHTDVHQRGVGRMSLHEYVEMLRRRWRWVTAVALTGLLIGVAGSLTATPTYRATSSLFFALKFGGSANELAQGSTFAQGQAASYAVLATTPAVLQPVIEELGLDTSVRALGHQVSTEVVPDTVVLEITATAADPRDAAELANAIGKWLIVAVEDLAPVTDDGDPTVEATTVAPATAPVAPATPRTTLNLAIGLLAGLLVGMLAGLVRDLTDTRIRKAEDLAQVTELPLLAGLDTPPQRDAGRDLVVVTAPRSPRAEAFRSLRTAVQFMVRPGGRLSLLVTSSRPAEGKSTVAANLALTLAEAGLRVALVDADLRRPSVADTLDLEGAAGLTSVLIGQAELDDVLQDWGAFGLHVLTTGPLPPNPSELLTSPAMSDLVARLEADHDVVVIDAPPLLPVTDAAILSRLTSGTLVVADASRTRRRVLAEALSILARVEARVVGVVLTHVPQRNAAVYGYESVGPASGAPPLSGGRLRPPADRRPAPPTPRPGPGSTVRVGGPQLERDGARQLVRDGARQLERDGARQPGRT